MQQLGTQPGPGRPQALPTGSPSRGPGGGGRSTGPAGSATGGGGDVGTAAGAGASHAGSRTGAPERGGRSGGRARAPQQQQSARKLTSFLVHMAGCPDLNALPVQRQVLGSLDDIRGSGRLSALGARPLALGDTQLAKRVVEVFCEMERKQNMRTEAMREVGNGILVGTVKLDSWDNAVLVLFVKGLAWELIVNRALLDHLRGVLLPRWGALSRPQLLELLTALGQLAAADRLAAVGRRRGNTAPRHLRIALDAAPVVRAVLGRPQPGQEPGPQPGPGLAQGQGQGQELTGREDAEAEAAAAGRGAGEGRRGAGAGLAAALDAAAEAGEGLSYEGAEEERVAAAAAEAEAALPPNAPVLLARAYLSFWLALLDAGAVSMVGPVQEVLGECLGAMDPGVTDPRVAPADELARMLAGLVTAAPLHRNAPAVEARHPLAGHVRSLAEALLQRQGELSGPGRAVLYDMTARLSARHWALPPGWRARFGGGGGGGTQAAVVPAAADGAGASEGAQSEGGARPEAVAAAVEAQLGGKQSAGGGGGGGDKEAEAASKAAGSLPR